MNLSWKYWINHKARAAALLLAVMSGVMAMTAGALFALSASRGSLEESLDSTGNYDVAAWAADDAELRKIAATEGVVRYETVLCGGTCRTAYSEELRVGSMDRAAQEIFHYEPERGGRYPEDTGEVCGYRSSFQALGVAPVPGTRFEVELFDADGNLAGNRSLTITGVINDQKAWDSHVRSVEYMVFGPDDDTPDTDFPELFVSAADLPDVRARIALIRCDPDRKPNDLENIMNGNGIIAADTGRVSELAHMSSTDVDTENEVYENARLAYHDFYSSFIIPIFFAVILFVSFVSVYGIMSDAVGDRQRRMGLLRGLGMPGRRVLGLLCGEGIFFAAAGTALGYALGVLLYVVCFNAANAIRDARVYSAFGADRLARAVSVDPFLWPWLLGLLFCALAVMVPIFRTVRRSPNEMLFPEKAGDAAVRARRRRGTAPSGLVRKVVRLGASGSAGVHALIFATGWVFVFGAVFMMGRADYENEITYELMGDSDDVRTDYIAHRDMYGAMSGNLNFNRHGEGVSAGDMDALARSEDVASVRGVMGLPGLKLLYPRDAPPSEAEDAMESLNIDRNIDETREELFRKAKKAYGYASKDRLYQIPAAAVRSEWIRELAPYVAEGELDAKGLADSSKVAVIEYPDARMENPFSAGDRLTLTEVVIRDPRAEGFDFSKGGTPPGCEPSFSFTDANGTVGPGYAFGSKVVFETEVCAVLRVDDADIQRMLYAAHAAYDGTDVGEASPGYQLLCDSGAPRAWGLPDERFTDVYVDLAEDADIGRFESLWYTVIGRSGDVRSVSNAGVRARTRETTEENLLWFAFMAALVLWAGCVGMANAYRFSVHRNRHNLQILRAVGMGGRAVALAHVREMFLWPLIAVVTAAIPIGAFDIVRRYAYYYAFELEHNFSQLAENGKWVSCWQVRFPWYIEVWKQPVWAAMLAGFLLIAGINIAAGVAPVRRMRRQSVVDGIRNEDF